VPAFLRAVQDVEREIALLKISARIREDRSSWMYAAPFFLKVILLPRKASLPRLVRLHNPEQA
jgi:hypothetical protein